MKRTWRPNLEALEPKTLLSTLAGPTPSMPHREAAIHAKRPVITVRFPHLPGLTVSVTTDKSVYQEGQTVMMSMTITNHSKHDVSVGIGPSVDVFVIAQKGKVVWRSNQRFTPQLVTLLTLHPGQSHAVTASWKASDTGTFAVHNTVAPKATATFQVVAA
jgi:hypothetical protein